MKHTEKYMKEMEELEDYAHFRAGPVEISPESLTLDEFKGILGDMIRSRVAMEDDMREDFAALGEAEQARLLDMLGESGYKDRDWWCRMILNGPRHHNKPTV